MQIVSYGGINLENHLTLEARLVYGDEGASVADTIYRQRHQRSPSVDRVSYASREVPFRVYTPDRNLANTSMLDAFNGEVNRIFSVRRDARQLVIKPHKNATDTRFAMARVTRLAKTDDGMWQGTFDLPDGRWLDSTLHDEDSFPIVVGGNTAASPVLYVTGGDQITRRRVTPRDRTGLGLSGELLRIPLDLDTEETVIFANGVSVPFRMAGNALWIRVDLPPGGTIPVDIYTGEAIENSTTAGTLDTAGLNLAASTMSNLRYESWEIERHPLAASGSWRPGLVTKHASSRPYTFGLTDPSISEFTLVDRITRGRRWDLPDDYDSAVMVSGIALEQLSNTQLEIFAGYTTFLDEIDVLERHRWVFSFHWAHSGSVTLEANGQTTTIDAPFQGIVHGLIAGAPWIMDVVTPAIHELYGAANVDIMASINNAHNGGASIRIEFKGALADMEVPVAQVTSNTLARHPEFGGHAISVTTDRIASPGITFPEDEEDSPGLVTAFIAVANRDEATWREIWSETVIGHYPVGQTITVAPVVSLLGTHRVAIGIRAASTRVDDFNYGVLTIKGNPVVTRAADQVPEIIISDPIPARLKHGKIESSLTGERIQLVDLFSDDVPVIIDCSGDHFGDRGIGAESGPVYMRRVDRTDPLRWLELWPGSQSLTGPFDVAVQWRDTWEL